MKGLIQQLDIYQEQGAQRGPPVHEGKCLLLHSAGIIGGQRGVLVVIAGGYEQWEGCQSEWGK